LYSTDIGLLSHTELIIKADLFDIDLFRDQLNGSRVGYLAFSYGDREFMMDTKGFDDLNLKLALKGLFINTPALIKVGYYGDFYKDQTKEIHLSKECFKKLKSSIINSFVKKDHKPIRYADSIKDPSFYYYLAKDDYNLFNTCNSWMGDRLRDGGLGISYWTPFADDIKID
jgi:hypothetical protein